MLFSSPVFLLRFLPAVLGAYFVAVLLTRGLGSRRLAVPNAVLLLSSLFFYAWGEQEIVLVMLASIAGNFGFGMAAARHRGQGTGRLVVGLAVAFNLGLLVYYKYAGFLADNVEALAGALDLDWVRVALPIGISFYTFQALSYVIDVYRGDAEAQRNPIDFAAYVALFPQLVAGPIVRYRDVAEQLVGRGHRWHDVCVGVRRFVIGLAKKLLIADTVALTCDRIFELPAEQWTASLAWLGIACYTIQIYFDFSGYSDMAIGLGRIFGFRFLENFRWPYAAASITEFWRRWHISLSTWFRDYLYIPLGGNRGGRSRTARNLLLVFFLCGLWHGAQWTFVLWGAFHGAFLVVERLGLGKRIAGLPRPLRHGYVLLVVTFGWVLFRAEDLGQAGQYLAAMVGLGAGDGVLVHPALVADRAVGVALAAGAVGAAPWVPWLRERVAGWSARGRLLVHTGATAALIFLMFASASVLAADTYTPFIYFRF